MTKSTGLGEGKKPGDTSNNGTDPGISGRAEQLTYGERRSDSPKMTGAFAESSSRRQDSSDDRVYDALYKSVEQSKLEAVRRMMDEPVSRPSSPNPFHKATERSQEQAVPQKTLESADRYFSKQSKSAEQQASSSSTNPFHKAYADLQETIAQASRDFHSTSQSAELPPRPPRRTAFRNPFNRFRSSPEKKTKDPDLTSSEGDKSSQTEKGTQEADHFFGMPWPEHRPPTTMQKALNRFRSSPEKKTKDSDPTSSEDKKRSQDDTRKGDKKDSKNPKLIKKNKELKDDHKTRETKEQDSQVAQKSQIKEKRNPRKLRKSQRAIDKHYAQERLKESQKNLLKATLRRFWKSHEGQLREGIKQRMGEYSQRKARFDNLSTELEKRMGIEMDVSKLKSPDERDEIKILINKRIDKYTRLDYENKTAKAKNEAETAHKAVDEAEKSFETRKNIDINERLRKSNIQKDLKSHAEDLANLRQNIMGEKTDAPQKATDVDQTQNQFDRLFKDLNEVKQKAQKDLQQQIDMRTKSRKTNIDHFEGVEDNLRKHIADIDSLEEKIKATHDTFTREKSTHDTEFTAEQSTFKTEREKIDKKKEADIKKFTEERDKILDNLDDDFFEGKVKDAALLSGLRETEGKAEAKEYYKKKAAKATKAKLETEGEIRKGSSELGKEIKQLEALDAQIDPTGTVNAENEVIRARISTTTNDIKEALKSLNEGTIPDKIPKNDHILSSLSDHRDALDRRDRRLDETNANADEKTNLQAQIKHIDTIINKLKSMGKLLQDREGFKDEIRDSTVNHETEASTLDRKIVDQYKRVAEYMAEASKAEIVYREVETSAKQLQSVLASGSKEGTIPYTREPEITLEGLQNGEYGELAKILQKLGPEARAKIEEETIKSIEGKVAEKRKDGEQDEDEDRFKLKKRNTFDNLDEDGVKILRNRLYAYSTTQSRLRIEYSKRKGLVEEEQKKLEALINDRDRELLKYEAVRGKESKHEKFAKDADIETIKYNREILKKREELDNALRVELLKKRSELQMKNEEHQLTLEKLSIQVEALIYSSKQNLKQALIAGIASQTGSTLDIGKNSMTGISRLAGN